MPPVNVATMPTSELIQHINELTVKVEKLQIDHAVAFKMWYDERADMDVVEGYDALCISLTRKITKLRNGIHKAKSEKYRRDIQEVRYQTSVRTVHA